MIRYQQELIVTSVFYETLTNYGVNAMNAMSKAVRHYMTAAGRDVSFLESVAVRNVRAGMASNHIPSVSESARKTHSLKAPWTADLIIDMWKHHYEYNPDDVNDEMVCVGISLLFNFLGRVSQICKSSSTALPLLGEVDPEDLPTRQHHDHAVLIKDIIYQFDDGTQMTCIDFAATSMDIKNICYIHYFQRTSKTTGEERARNLVLTNTPDKDAFLVERLIHFGIRSGLNHNDTFFFSRRKQSSITRVVAVRHLRAHDINTKISEVAKRNHLTFRLFSSRSLRVGGKAALRHRGEEDATIDLIGNWKSKDNASQSYDRFLPSCRGSLSGISFLSYAPNTLMSSDVAVRILPWSRV